MTINSEKKENALGTLTYDGKIYGIPYSTAGIGLVYNKTVLDKAVGGDFDPSTIKTRSDLAELFDQIEATGAAAWKYLPVNYGTNIGSVENTLQKTWFRNNLKGEKIRLKFTNKYGVSPLILDRVMISGEKDTDQRVQVTCRGNTKIVIHPGEEFLSDEFDWQTVPGENIVLFVFFKERQEIHCAAAMWSVKCCHTVYRSCENECDIMAEVSEDEWKESREIYPYIEADVNKANVVAGVCEIQVYTDPEVKTLAMFGDSITHMSYFSDGLMDILMERAPGGITLVNYGIGGNRILRNASYVEDMEGNGSCFGPAGAGRFESDVFSDDTPDVVLVLEGVNDIMHPYMFGHDDDIVTAGDLEKGMKEIIDISHRHGCPVYVGTVMPFWDAQYGEWFEPAEYVRRQFNQWIREQSDAEGVLDYDRAAADGMYKERMKDGIHIGDGLHPNTKGGQLMAQTAYRVIQNSVEK